MAHRLGGPRAHVKVRDNRYELMAFATPSEGPLGYRQESGKVRHGHENVAS